MGRPRRREKMASLPTKGKISDAAKRIMSAHTKKKNQGIKRKDQEKKGPSYFRGKKGNDPQKENTTRSFSEKKETLLKTTVGERLLGRE